MFEEVVNKRLIHGDRVGKYEVLEYLASGGMGAVYKARDVDLGRVVALKILPSVMARQPKMLDRFRREARAAARLQHENIVAIYECGEHDGVFFLALEYVPGIDLQNYIEKRRKLPPDEARQIILQAARALAHAHEQKIVHRDVKPSNFLLTRKDGRLIVKLTDLGLAIHPSDEEFRLTREGTTVGTVDYMAPEQARDSGSADSRSDIYSLGCTFYHMLAGTAPFARGTMTERLLQHLQDEAPDVRNLNKEVPPGYVAILQRMLAKKPEDRYQNPEELIRDLQDPDSAVRRDTQPPVARAAPPSPVTAVARKAHAPQRDNASDDEPAPPMANTPRRFRDPPDPRQQTRDRTNNGEAAVGPTTRPDPVRPAERKRGSGVSVPPWVYFAGTGAAVLVVACVGLVVSTRPAPEHKKDPPVPQPIAPVVVAPDPDAGKKDTTLKVAGDGNRVGPDRPALPALYQAAAPLDVAGLRRDFFGPHESFPQPPAGAPVQIVSRGAAPGSGAVRSLAEALAQAPPGASVIEIHDRGPLFVGNLPVLDGRDVFLRGGPGFRPLLAWEPPRTLAKGTAGPVLLAQRRGLLAVEGLDIVVKWMDPQTTGPACLLEAAAGSLHVRDCTFSLSGKHPHGIIMARLQNADDPSSPETPRLRVARCYARGADLMALRVDGTSADILIDDSLLVGNHLPLLRMACREADEVKLRIVRSTLVSAQNLLRVQDASGKGGTPRLSAMVWDSILARNDPAAPEGDLILLAGGAEASRMSWRAIGSLYAGWKKLIAGGAVAVDGNDLNAWHAQWQANQGDRTLLETWPNNPPAQLEDLPAAVFSPYDTPVAFAATAGGGPVGVVVGRLPFEPADWLKRTYERLALAMPPSPESGPPAIDTASDGLYHGERVELPARADLGLVLTKLLQGKPLAPRVVFHVAGSGEHASSPLRMQGIAELVLFFEPARDAKTEPLTLTVDPKGVLDRPALFEVDRGSLELIGAHVRLENSKSAIMPPHIIKVVGGNVFLHRCQLQGPLGKSPDAFRSLIALAGPAREPLVCRLSECVLLSGKGVVHTGGAAVRLWARNNVVLALGDALQLDLAGALESGQTMCQLDSNTWALRRALFALKAGPYLDDRSDPVLFNAAANYFTDPFGEQPAQSTMLRIPEPLLSRGQLVWQGKGNAFDRRLESFFAMVGRPAAEKQALADWLQLWGRAGEQDALVVEPGTAIKSTLATDAPQLDRLALPREFRPEPGNPVPGADLLRLGLLKKK